MRILTIVMLVAMTLGCVTGCTTTSESLAGQDLVTCDDDGLAEAPVKVPSELQPEPAPQAGCRESCYSSSWCTAGCSLCVTKNGVLPGMCVSGSAVTSDMVIHE